LDHAIFVAAAALESKTPRTVQRAAMFSFRCCYHSLAVFHSPPIGLSSKAISVELLHMFRITAGKLAR
jgi:hypothetical protein